MNSAIRRALVLSLAVTGNGALFALANPWPGVLVLALFALAVVNEFAWEYIEARKQGALAANVAALQEELKELRSQVERLNAVRGFGG